MRRFAIALFLTPLVVASAPAQPQPSPLQQALNQAQAEQAAAEAQTARLEKVAASARGEA